MREKCTYGNKAESELLCVRVATALIKQICNHTKSDVIREYVSELSKFLFYCSRYLPSLNNCPGKKKITIALAKTLVRNGRKANEIQMCDIICRCLHYDCGI